MVARHEELDERAPDLVGGHVRLSVCSGARSSGVGACTRARRRRACTPPRARTCARPDTFISVYTRSTCGTWCSCRSCPAARARRAGRRVEPRGPPADVVAAGGADDYCVPPARAAVGVRPALDLEGAGHLAGQVYDRRTGVIERHPARVLALDRAGADRGPRVRDEVRDPAASVEVRVPVRVVAGVGERGVDDHRAAVATQGDVPYPARDARWRRRRRRRRQRSGAIGAWPSADDPPAVGVPQLAVAVRRIVQARDPLAGVPVGERQRDRVGAVGMQPSGTAAARARRSGAAPGSSARRSSWSRSRSPIAGPARTDRACCPRRAVAAGLDR